MSERQDDSDQGDAGQQAGSDSGVSALLRASRMRIGEDLREVANVLRIRYRYLEDIEAGRFADLPGNTYAVGFIRTYADHLGLDGEEVVRRYKEEAAASKGESNLEFPAPISESGIPAGALMFVGVVIAVLAYGAWYISTSDKNFIAELISPLPERLVTMLPEEERKAAAAASEASTPTAAETEQPTAETAPAPEAADSGEAQKTEPAPAEQSAEQPVESGASAPTAASEPVSPEPTPVESANSEAAAKPAEPAQTSEAAQPVETLKPVETVAPVAETPAPKKEMAVVPEKMPEKAPEKTEAKPAAAAAGEQAAAEKKPDAPESTTQSAPVPETVVASQDGAGRVYGAENKDARIVVLAKMNSWIQVRDDVANQLLLTRLLRQGDSYRVPNRGGLKLLAGNAGALEISVDGKTVPPIGPQGAVRRSVVLDAEKLQQGKAVVE